MRWRLERRDLLFLVDTLMPASDDRERAVDLVQSDAGLIEAILDDDRLFPVAVWLPKSHTLMFPSQ